MPPENNSLSSDDLDRDLQLFLDEVSDPGPARLSDDARNRIQRIAVFDEDAASRTRPEQLGPYRILEPLGAGGMGMVYRARHLSLDRDVALKTLPEQAVTPVVLERFHREMRVLAQLSHPHVVSALDGNIVDQQIYLAMELVEGCDLRRLSDSQLLGVADCCELLRQAALGVSALHAKHIIHRDLKPTNIMVSNDGIVKVVDLGLAKNERDEHNVTEPAAVLGTTAFMSPELHSGTRAPDAACDLFALGRTLQFLLKIGPFCNREMADQPQVPRDLVTLISELTTDDADQRLADARVLAQRLQPWAVASRFYTEAIIPAMSTAATTSAAATDRSEQSPLPPRRRPPTKFLGVGAVSVILLCLVWGWSWGWSFFVADATDADATRDAADDVSQTEPPAAAADETYTATSVLDPPITREEKLQRERSVAEWLLQHGGTVQINYAREDGTWNGKPVASLTELPDAELVVQNVQLSAETFPTREHRQQISRLLTLEGLNLLHRDTPADILDGMNPAWELKWVYLPSTKFTDNSVEALAGYQATLLAVDLHHSAITDEAGKLIASFAKLRSLQIAGTKISDVTVRHLQRCPNLVHLDLSETRVTGAGIRLLSNYPALRRLHLDGLHFSDDDFATLHALPLTELSLADTNVSRAAVDRFQAAQPNCVVQSVH